MAVVNLSFAACGFMGIYQLGAVGALLRHGEKLLACMKTCAGASAGALVATVLITAPDKVERCKEFTYKFANSVRSQRLGAVTPGYDFMLELREGIEEILPPNAHCLASGRLHISVTHSKTGQNSIVSSFTSREELAKVSIRSIHLKPKGMILLPLPCLGSSSSMFICCCRVPAVPLAGSPGQQLRPRLRRPEARRVSRTDVDRRRFHRQPSHHPWGAHHHHLALQRPPGHHPPPPGPQQASTQVGQHEHHVFQGEHSEAEPGPVPPTPPQDEGAGGGGLR